MAFIDKRYTIDFCPNQGIAILQCGWQKCYSNHKSGPRLYPHHSITFVIRGRGTVYVNNVKRTVQAGEGFVIFPGESTLCIADQNDPWEYYFAIFSGFDVSALLESANISHNHPTFAHANDESMHNMLDLLWQASSSGAALGYDIIGQFYLCMSTIIRNNQSEHTAQADDSQSAYIDKAVKYMRANYSYQISVSDIASYIGLNRSYFYRLFTQKMQCAPSQWLLNYRLNRSKELLEQTDLSIAEIGSSVGFYDASHFSKSFQKAFHCPPGDFRKHIHSE